MPPKLTVLRVSPRVPPPTTSLSLSRPTVVELSPRLVPTVSVERSPRCAASACESISESWLAPFAPCSRTYSWMSASSWARSGIAGLPEGCKVISYRSEVGRQERPKGRAEVSCPDSRPQPLPRWLIPLRRCRRNHQQQSAPEGASPCLLVARRRYVDRL